MHQKRNIWTQVSHLKYYNFDKINNYTVKEETIMFDCDFDEIYNEETDEVEIGTFDFSLSEFEDFDDDSEDFDDALSDDEIETAFDEEFCYEDPPTREEMLERMEGYCDIDEDASDIEVKRRYLEYREEEYDAAEALFFPNGRDYDAEDEDGPLG